MNEKVYGLQSKSSGTCYCSGKEVISQVKGFLWLLPSSLSVQDSNVVYSCCVAAMANLAVVLRGLSCASIGDAMQEMVAPGLC